MKWAIGNVEIKNQVVLAPMAGVSNPSYIKICEEMGLGYAITELISAEAIVRQNQKTLDMLNGIDKLNIPVAVQLFGANPQTIAQAAKYIEQTINPAIIDINMGCPVPKVAQRAEAGSALLKDPSKVYEIVKAVVKAVNIPVTVKIRSGWDHNSINAVEIAQICENAGASCIALHARTRSQGYSGNADWNIIKQVKEAVKIPVIGNGDIKTPEDAKKMLEYTNCDAIMIGRAALGNPWLIEATIEYLEKGILLTKKTKEDKIEMIRKHLNYLLKIKPEKIAICEMRTHATHYLKGLPQTADIKNKIFKTTNIQEFNKILDEYLKTSN